MSKTPSQQTRLQDIRNRLDLIDNQLHDLIMERCALAEQVKQVKINDKMWVHPKREAEIINRLMQRHKGVAPKKMIIRIWRELIGTMTGLERVLHIASLGEEFMLLARDHYGGSAQISAYKHARDLLGLILQEQITIGLFPTYGQGDLTENSPYKIWWIELALAAWRQESNPLEIFCRLPLYYNEPHEEALDALCVAKLTFTPAAPTDRLVQAVQAPSVTEIKPIRDLLRKAGYQDIKILNQTQYEQSAWMLIETDLGRDPTVTLSQSLQADGVCNIFCLGGYPTALTL